MCFKLVLSHDILHNFKVVDSVNCPISVFGVSRRRNEVFLLNRSHHEACLLRVPNSAEVSTATALVIQEHSRGQLPVSKEIRITLNTMRRTVIIATISVYRRDLLSDLWQATS